MGPLLHRCGEDPRLFRGNPGNRPAGADGGGYLAALVKDGRRHAASTHHSFFVIHGIAALTDLSEFLLVKRSMLREASTSSISSTDK